MPALAAGFQRNLQSQDIDNPATLGDQAAVTDGNGILGHLLGSKDVSRRVASRAAAQTGLSAEVLKRMLPLAATLMMGTFSKQSAGGSSLSAGSVDPAAASRRC